jgi:hypothetical protein
VNCSSDRQRAAREIVLLDFVGNDAQHHNDAAEQEGDELDVLASVESEYPAIVGRSVILRTIVFVGMICVPKDQEDQEERANSKHREHPQDGPKFAAKDNGTDDSIISLDAQTRYSTKKRNVAQVRHLRGPSSAA